MPRILLLFAIWGIAVFLWGTFGAWTKTQHLHYEQELARTQSSLFRTWLADAFTSLERLAVDPRLAAGMDLPSGVESLPIQRVLYEYSYLTNRPEVYAIDLMRKRVGRTAGASSLSPEFVARLMDLPDSERMILASGQRNGQIMLIRKVKAPLPNRLVVAVPVSSATMGNEMPSPRLPEERSLSMVVPHTVGWVAWHGGEQGFVIDDGLNSAVGAAADTYTKDLVTSTLVPLDGWPDVWLELKNPKVIDGTRMLPQVLVALWALMMTAMVLWPRNMDVAKKARSLAKPMLDPLGRFTAPMNVAVGRIAQSFSTQWREATNEQPIVDGPGGFDKRDFDTPEAMMRRMYSGGTKRRPSGASLKLGQGAKEQVNKERRARPRGGDAQKAPPKMAWPADREPLPPKPKKDEDRDLPIDKDDLDAVVKDCLAKKRVKLLYQPIYRTADNIPVMHEVYARLLRSTGEIIPPDQFMPIIMKNRMSLELDLIVLRKVVHEHFAGGGSPVTSLALNISSTSLDGIAYLQEMTNQGSRVLQKLGFEVSSQEMIRDPKALKLLKDLQKNGGNLAVDYFGGGTAMLDASRSLGFNYVKMNCSRLIGTDAGKKEIITLCQHAKSMNLPVILEMVGDKESLAFARRAGAEFLQGYALARPDDMLQTSPLPL